VQGIAVPISQLQWLPFEVLGIAGAAVDLSKSSE
jgi:hypothetical protein